MTNKAAYKLAIVMPAYNAAQTIVPTLNRIPIETLKLKFLELTVYLVNDGSTDHTPAILEGYPNPTSFLLKVLHHAHNKGYGAAQKTGIKAALSDGNELILLLHSDGQYAPEEMMELLSPLMAERAHLVIGSKFLKGKVLRQGMPFSRFLGIKFFDWLENIIFGLSNLEFNSGYMAYHAQIFRNISWDQMTDKFHFDGEMVRFCAKNKFKIIRVPISTCYSESVSKLKPIPYVMEILTSLLKIRK